MKPSSFATRPLCRKPRFFFRTLDARGDLILNSFDGGHTEYTMDWWNEHVLPMFDTKFDDVAETLVV